MNNNNNTQNTHTNAPVTPMMIHQLPANASNINAPIVYTHPGFVVHDRGHDNVELFSSLNQNHVWFNINAVRVDFIWKDIKGKKLYLFLLDVHRDRMTAVVSNDLLQTYEHMNLLGCVFAIKHFQVEDLIPFIDDYPRYEGYSFNRDTWQIMITKNTKFELCAETTTKAFPLYPNVASIQTHANEKSNKRLMIDVIGKISSGKLRTYTHQVGFCELVLYDLTGHELKLNLYHNSHTLPGMLARGIQEKWIVYASRVKLIIHQEKGMRQFPSV